MKGRQLDLFDMAEIPVFDRKAEAAKAEVCYQRYVDAKNEHLTLCIELSSLENGTTEYVRVLELERLAAHARSEFQDKMAYYVAIGVWGHVDYQ
jgi:hypothetical protein